MLAPVSIAAALVWGRGMVGQKRWPHS